MGPGQFLGRLHYRYWMEDRRKVDRYASHRGDQPSPRASSIDHDRRRDASVGGPDTNDPILLYINAGNLCILEDLGAMTASSFGQTHRGRVGIGVSGIRLDGHGRPDLAGRMDSLVNIQCPISAVRETTLRSRVHSFLSPLGRGIG